MTRRTRRIIFYVLLILFFILGTGVVLYADGWRINLTNFRTEKVGGIYVRAYPQDALIALDGQSIQNQSNFLNHGTLISNLYPKNYTLSLSETGYDAWHENAGVEPSLVVEMKYAVLVPQTGTAVTTSSDVNNFFEIGADHVDQHSNGTITWRNTVIGTGAITNHSTDLKNMIYETPNGTSDLYDFTTGKTLNLSLLLQKQRITTSSIGTIMIDPYNDTATLVSSRNRVLTIDLSAQTVATIATSSAGQTLAPAIAASQTSLAWSEYNSATGTSTIIVYDKFAGIVTRTISVTGATQSLAWINADTLGILQSNGSLLLYTFSSETLRPLASDVKAFYPTADGSLLAALEKNSLEIFDFAGSDYYRFNLPDMETVQSLAWYKDQTHLFASYPDHVAFVDLADTSLVNVITVSAGTHASYDANNNALYLIDGGNIISFAFPN
ncbi:MAG TPA: hypothetical protein VMU07_01190 [Candidatus Paceibacterota bacterium]|nr:hypothetical protein [Candidatus Paceibacterota bacterium]